MAPLAPNLAIVATPPAGLVFCDTQSVITQLLRRDLSSRWRHIRINLGDTSNIALAGVASTPTDTGVTVAPIDTSAATLADVASAVVHTDVAATPTDTGGAAAPAGTSALASAGVASVVVLTDVAATLAGGAATALAIGATSPTSLGFYDNQSVIAQVDDHLVGTTVLAPRSRHIRTNLGFIDTAAPVGTSAIAS